MAKQKRTLITKRRLERIIIRQQQKKSQIQRCPLCKKESVFLSVEEVSMVFDLGVFYLQHLLKTEEIHFTGELSNSPNICVSSLRRVLLDKK